jgi:uracil phosphoribosyltransferase
VTTFLAVAATRDLRMRQTGIETPLEPTQASVSDEPIVVVAILRAGAGMIDCIVRLLPEVSVGYIGLERNEETAEARRYYCKFPPIKGQHVLVVDPMLATGGSAEQALEAVYEAGALKVGFLCIVAAPEGVQRLESRFPDVRIFAGALDRELDTNKYIRPGLGDFGDRLYGT